MNTNITDGRCPRCHKKHERKKADYCSDLCRKYANLRSWLNNVQIKFDKAYEKELAVANTAQ